MVMIPISTDWNVVLPQDFCRKVSGVVWEVFPIGRKSSFFAFNRDIRSRVFMLKGDEARYVIDWQQYNDAPLRVFDHVEFSVRRTSNRESAIDIPTWGGLSATALTILPRSF